MNVSRLTVDEARNDAATTMAAILTAVAAARVAKKDVRTSLLSVQPRYEYRDNEPPRLAGYELANVVEVTVRNLAKLGDVIDGALKAGATSMDSLNFRLDDPSPAEKQARTLAMAQARIAGGRSGRGGRTDDHRRLGRDRGWRLCTAASVREGRANDDGNG